MIGCVLNRTLQQYTKLSVSEANEESRRLFQLSIKREKNGNNLIIRAPSNAAANAASAADRAKSTPPRAVRVVSATIKSKGTVEMGNSSNKNNNTSNTNTNKSSIDNSNIHTSNPNNNNINNAADHDDDDVDSSVENSYNNNDDNDDDDSNNNDASSSNVTDNDDDDDNVEADSVSRPSEASSYTSHVTESNNNNSSKNSKSVWSKYKTASLPVRFFSNKKRNSAAK